VRFTGIWQVKWQPTSGYDLPGRPAHHQLGLEEQLLRIDQPKEWRELTVELQAGDPDSMLELYRAALRLRRAEPALGDGTLRWLPAPAGVLAFGRGDLSCVANLSPAPVTLPAHTAVLLASGALDDNLLPPDTAAWLRTSRPLP
jgi:alpha-glucosidase